MKAPAIYRTLSTNTTDLGRSAGNKHPTKPNKHRTKKLCTLFLRGKGKTTCIHQTMY